jgi:hypothetical protein
VVVCQEERESRAWREGLIFGLMDCYESIKEDGKRTRALRADILAGLRMLAPNDYANYRRRATRGRDGCLTHWEWRTLTAELHDLLAVADLLDCPPGPRAEHLRRLLALGPEDPLDGPAYVHFGLHAVNSFEPDSLDGEIDAHYLCLHWIERQRLTTTQLANSILAELHILWPQDYLHYHRRFCQLYHQDAGDSHTGLYLDFRAWLHAVEDLHAELAACAARGQPPGAELILLDSLLLREPGESLPSLDWQAPGSWEEVRRL